MDNILDSITEQLGNLGIGDVKPLLPEIPPRMSEDIRTIQERALEMAVAASGPQKTMAQSHELAALAHQLLSFTKRFLEDYHGKPDQADS